MKGRTLEEIDRLFQMGLPAWRWRNVVLSDLDMRVGDGQGLDDEAHTGQASIHKAYIN